MLVKTGFDTAVTALKTAIIICLCMYVCIHIADDIGRSKEEGGEERAGIFAGDA